jgi:copper chaperone CopZ
MELIRLKTNVMCGACVENVTPVLNETVGEESWEIDLKNLRKILTVSGKNVDAEQVISALNKVGYKADKV